MDIEPNILNGCVFQSKGWYDYALGSILIVGVIVSYIPQYIKILQNKSSKGISYLAVYLSNVSTASNTLNVVLERYNVFACCGMFPFAYECISTLLPLIQISLGFLNCFPLFILVLLYFPEEDEEPKNAKPLVFSAHKQKKYASYLFISVIVINVLILPVVGFALLFKYGATSTISLDYAFAIGVISSVGSVLHWAPQIWKTFRAKDPGSLSILMLLLQAPGSFLVVIFQFEYHESITTLFPYLLTGIQQILLLIECIVFELRKRWKAKEQEQIENKPLLTAIQ